eukprot:COSAG01_NODE_3452_length_6079_cov_5.725753_4_plen_133_part_00
MAAAEAEEGRCRRAVALALLHDVGAIAEQLALRHGVQLLGFEGATLTVVPEGIGAAATGTATDSTSRRASAPPHSHSIIITITITITIIIIISITIIIISISISIIITITIIIIAGATINHRGAVANLARSR